MVIDFFTGKRIPDPGDTGKHVHTCTICGKNFNWDRNSGWYGSYKNAENTAARSVRLSRDI